MKIKEEEEECVSPTRGFCSSNVISGGVAKIEWGDLFLF